MYYVVNDVETSGRSPWHHDVISCGLVIMDRELNIIDTFKAVCCPWYPKNFDHETTAIHGMSLSWLMNQQSSYDMCLDILNFLDKYRDQEKISYLPFIFHALNRFDFRFVDNLFYKNSLEFSFRKVFNRQHAISTVEMARERGYEENGLAKWCERLSIDLKHHDALSDTLACAKIYKHLINMPVVKKDSDIKVKTKKDKEIICPSLTQNFLLV